MSKSTHQIQVKAVNKTSSTFNEIKSSATATAASMRSILGGALSGLGAYFGARSFVNGINELGELSDIAQKTSTSVDELTRASTAFAILGVKSAPADIARAFQMMEKNTGRMGMSGFYETLDELGKIPDTAKRSEAAMKVFGRSGLEFMPLINAANEGTSALQGVIDAMPRIPQSAADAGDKMADAIAVSTNGFKSVWLGAVGAICNSFDSHFTGGIRQAAAEAANALEYYAKLAVISVERAWKQITGHMAAVGSYWGSVIGTLSGGGSIGEALSAGASAFAEGLAESREELEALDRVANERATRWAKERAERSAAIAKLQESYNKAAGSTNSRNLTNSLDSAVAKMTKISNQLIMGNSNESTKLQAFGPQLQSETKKQTELLERIANNTEATNDDGYQPWDK